MKSVYLAVGLWVLSFQWTLDQSERTQIIGEDTNKTMKQFKWLHFVSKTSWRIVDGNSRSGLCVAGRRKCPCGGGDSMPSDLTKWIHPCMRPSFILNIKPIFTVKKIFFLAFVVSMLKLNVYINRISKKKNIEIVVDWSCNPLLNKICIV